MHASLIHRDARAFLTWSCMQHKYTYEMEEEESQRLRKKRALRVNTQLALAFRGNARVNSHGVHTDVLGFL